MTPSAGARTKAPRRRRWRPWLRALHRDIGYLAVGLTFVYALSGLAVNHIADWDPNFKQVSAQHQLTPPLPHDDEQLWARLSQELELAQRPTDVYWVDEQNVELTFADRTLHVGIDSGVVFEQGQEPRFLLRAANWLHLNRGKRAWTYVADGYAVFLLFLASSGLFMLPGRKGFFGRGAVLALLGAAVPVIYVALSGP